MYVCIFIVDRRSFCFSLCGCWSPVGLYLYWYYGSWTKQVIGVGYYVFLEGNSFEIHSALLDLKISHSNVFSTSCCCNPQAKKRGLGRLSFEVQGSEQAGGCHGCFSLFRNSNMWASGSTPHFVSYFPPIFPNFSHDVSACFFTRLWGLKDFIVLQECEHVHICWSGRLGSECGWDTAEAECSLENVWGIFLIVANTFCLSGVYRVFFFIEDAVLLKYFSQRTFDPDG